MLSKSDNCGDKFAYDVDDSVGNGDSVCTDDWTDDLYDGVGDDDGDACLGWRRPDNDDAEDVFLGVAAAGRHRRSSTSSSSASASSSS